LLIFVDQRARLETAEVQVWIVKGPPALGVGVKQNLEPAVKAEGTVGIGPDPATRPVGTFKDPDLEAGLDQSAGAGQSGHAGTDHKDIRRAGVHKERMIVPAERSRATV
jgi:hypothetical protein